MTMTDIRDLPADQPPRLITVVDTEEEFDWDADFDRSNTAVSHMAHIRLIQDIFDRHEVTPVYVVDYPIASQELGYALLQDYAAAGRAVIGAHLHPWVSPPHVEDVTRPNSYPGNLPRDLEAEKLAVLARQIEKSFGRRPTIYKAGRYGKGPHTHEILEEQGFEIDISPSPPLDSREDGGPDYRWHTTSPYLFGQERRLLCLPNTGAFVGYLNGVGPAIHPILDHPALRWARLPGIATRLGALERIRLSPEGFTLAEMTRLTRALMARGHRTFVLSFHSPSVCPGHTPYVRDDADLEAFLEKLNRYYGFFKGPLNGRVTTPHEIKIELEGGDASQST